MSEVVRYSDEELQEFKEIILAKLAKAQAEYDTIMADMSNEHGNDTADTSPTFKTLEEGALTNGKEEACRMAQRQAKFISHLKAALMRIEEYAERRLYDRDGARGAEFSLTYNFKWGQQERQSDYGGGVVMLSDIKKEDI